MNIENAKIKSQLIQLFLTVVFGPFGLFYSSKAFAIIGCLMSIAMLGAFLFGAFLMWPPAIVTGYFCVREHNKLASKYIAFRKRQIEHLAKVAT